MEIFGPSPLSDAPSLEGKPPTIRSSGSLSIFPLTRPKGLITAITIPLNTKFAFEFVSKTPADKPLICAALNQWKSGRARLAPGGYAKSPLLAMVATAAE